MGQRNVIEEIEARLDYIPRWRMILGVILLIPPITILGMGFFTYELHRAGKKLRADETGTPSIAKSEPDR